MMEKPHYQFVISILFGAGLTLGIVLLVSYADKQKEQPMMDICQYLAEKVHLGNLNIDRYLAARCPAKYINLNEL